MAVTLGGKPCLAPEIEVANCRDLGYPTAPWQGRANAFVCPLGQASGSGYALLLREDLDALGLDTVRDLVFTDQDGVSIRLKNLLLVRSGAVTPGKRAAGDAAVWVELADRRRVAKATVIDKAYNVRSTPGSATYYSATLNSGSPWTWAQMASDLWTAVGTSRLGTFPGLPFTPDGTPEGFEFYGSYAYDALGVVLDRLSCALELDPITDTFSIVRLGATDTVATLELEAQDQKRIWDGEPEEGLRANRPQYVRVLFPKSRAIPDTTGGSPWYVADVADPSGTPTGVESGTYAILRDDLPAVYDASNTLTNSAALTARATERATDYYRRARLTRRQRTYDELLGAVGVRPGSQVTAIRWADQGNGFLTSLVTSDGLLFESRPPRDGRDGTNGVDGEPGKRGATGATGEAGEAGSDGISTWVTVGSPSSVFNSTHVDVWMVGPTFVDQSTHININNFVQNIYNRLSSYTWCFGGGATFPSGATSYTTLVIPVRTTTGQPGSTVAAGQIGYNSADDVLVIADDASGTWRYFDRRPDSAAAGDLTHYSSSGGVLSLSRLALGSTGLPLVAGASAPQYAALGVAGGGTGITSFTQYATLYASTTSTLAELAPNTSTTRKWLSQIGDGTSPFSPSWTQPTFAQISGTAAVGQGGTGTTGTPSNGQLLIGNGTGFTLATLTAGSGITVTNGSGTITIAATGSGITSLNGLTGATQTFANDTNVTMVSAGTTHTITWAGTLGVTRGGTGAGSWTPYTVVSTNSSGTAFTGTAPNTSTTKKYLSMTGTGSVGATPSWDQPAFSELTGSVGATSGGTGQTTYAQGDILYASATNTLSKLAKGTRGRLLQINATVPNWYAAGELLGSNYVSTDQTTTSGSPVDLTTADSVTFTLYETRTVVVRFTANVYNTSAVWQSTVIDVDGTDKDTIYQDHPNANTLHSLTCTWEGSLTSGSHTIKAQHAVSSGTGHWANRLLTVHAKP